MRKRVLTPTPPGIRPHDEGWLDLDRAASVEVTSEEKNYGIDSALVSGETQGWRAASPGTQTIRLLFDQPQRLRRISLVFEETETERTQEFVLRWSPDGGRSFREIVRQQWNFSPLNTIREVEEYRVEISDVTVLELVIVPDIGRGAARASLRAAPVLILALEGNEGMDRMLRQIVEFVAVLSCGLFTGAAVYVSLVEHPARMECGVEIATAEFPPSYHRGTIMQVTLAAVCLLSSIAAWLAGATFWWVVAGVLQVSVIPFTLIVILPTNKQLLSSTLDRRSVQTERLLALWGTLHAVRSVLSAVALLLFLYLAVFRKPL